GQDISADALGNIAHPDKVANPDNMFFSEGMRTLFIGEDSGTHVNNFVWAYNVDSGKLSRILSLPSGAESTGLQVVDNVNGHAYIMSNNQHQGEWISSMPASVKSALTAEATALHGVNAYGTPNYYLEAHVGYIGGIPGL
ncbi:MAG: alkaline phosphatase, partial [Ectothiorhodospiraceae bacterium]|nr:alkaline phosphatase [Ectothiorhodospiraceae bacterium]